MDKIPVGISSCLIGEEVRWNGGHKHAGEVVDTFGGIFRWVPVCPEVEVGMGVPREAVGLYGSPDQPLMLGNESQTDWTAGMNDFSLLRVKELEAENLCGFIFKSKSPSCGVRDVPVYKAHGSRHSQPGRGLFAAAFLKCHPLIPVADEEELRDLKTRENFIARVRQASAGDGV